MISNPPAYSRPVLARRAIAAVRGVFAFTAGAFVAIAAIYDT